MNKWKFDFRQRVMKPDGKTQVIVTSRGEDMDYGRYYGTEGFCTRGRPANASFWESDLVASNPAPSAAKPKPAKRKSKKSAAKRKR